MEMLGKVRKTYYRDGLSRSEIARRTELSRNTIKKWLSTGRRFNAIPSGIYPGQARAIPGCAAPQACPCGIILVPPHH
jgi:hypothetical protein